MVYLVVHAKLFQGYRTLSPGDEEFKGFNNIWKWRHSWSCDQDHFHKFINALPKEAPYKI